MNGKYKWCQCSALNIWPYTVSLGDHIVPSFFRKMRVPLNSKKEHYGLVVFEDSYDRKAKFIWFHCYTILWSKRQTVPPVRNIIAGVVRTLSSLIIRLKIFASTYGFFLKEMDDFNFVQKHGRSTFWKNGTIWTRIFQHSFTAVRYSELHVEQ